MADKSRLVLLAAAADKELTPAIHRLYGSGAFAVLVGAGLTAERSVQKVVGSVTGRMWHAVNLPTRTDINRVRGLVAELDHELRNLQRSLEEKETAHVDAR